MRTIRDSNSSCGRSMKSSKLKRIRLAMRNNDCGLHSERSNTGKSIFERNDVKNEFDTSGCRLRPPKIEMEMANKTFDRFTTDATATQTLKNKWNESESCRLREKKLFYLRVDCNSKPFRQSICCVNVIIRGKLQLKMNP